MTQTAQTQARSVLVGILRGKFYVWTPEKETQCALETGALREALAGVGLGASTKVAHFASMASPEKAGAPAGFRARAVLGRAVRQLLRAA